METWLRDDLPDASVAIDGYNLIRKDRKSGPGGGLACFFKPELMPEVLTESNITSLSECATEFLPIIFGHLSLLVIICYHPFWNNAAEHNAAIDCLLDILDYVAVSKSFSTAPRILVVGDFNDLSRYFDTISSLSGLCSAVSFPTSDDRILDQLFSNFNDLYSPPEKLSPIGRSDHCSILWGPVFFLIYISF